MNLRTCQPGYESVLVREVEAGGSRAAEHGPGWVLEEPVAADPENRARETAYSHLVLESAAEVRGDTVNALAHAIFGFFAAGLQGERIVESWPCVFWGAAEPEGLGPRVRSVEGAFHDLLKRKMGRLAKLASPAAPRGLGPARGLFVGFTDFGRAFASRQAWRNGQRRMADDPLAPSRSYLKAEEAYGILGCEPRAGETVCDLGAAPGGWSYSAAKRGATVVAVDNGPLKSGAFGHAQIEHRMEDAFGFAPPAGAPFDWLFCDMLESPHRILGSIVAPWLAGRWCRRFVVNFKLGRVDPLAFLSELAAAGSPLVLHAADVRIRHLYHDRDEVTAVGRLRE